MTSLWGSLAPAQPRGLFGSDNDWLLARAINGLGFGPMTQATQAGRPNGYISNGPVRPSDFLAPVAETISPTMGAYGAGQMAAEGSRAIGRGDYLSGGAGLALGMAGMIPGAPKKGIRAFHGSPHDFDRFDMSKIGTGEGAQAYGHGLYFAEAEDTAKFYRDALSKKPTIDGAPVVDTQMKTVTATGNDFLDKAIRQGFGDLALVRKDLEAMKTWDAGSDLPVWQGIQARKRSDAAKALADLDALESSGRVGQVSPGRMYEVRINADPEDFLDYDTPVAEQPQKVRDALDKLRDKAGVIRGGYNDEVMAGPLDGYRTLVEQTIPRGEFENTLRELGIPGIKYLDQGSRSAGDGSRNYVVFDDKLIDILRKYGLFGSLGMGGASGLFGTGEQSQ